MLQGSLHRNTSIDSIYSIMTTGSKVWDCLRLLGSDRLSILRSSPRSVGWGGCVVAGPDALLS